MSTNNFSSLGEIMNTRLIATGEKCKIHGTNLVTAFDKPAVCLECATIKRDKEVAEMREKLTDRHLKRNGHDWLKERSIYLDHSLKRATFDTYDAMDEETTKNKEMALRIARDYFKGASFNTVLTGKAGTGKSHLAMAILKVVNEHSEPGFKTLFISVDELMKRIRDSFSDKSSVHTEQRMTEMLIEADLLVIDDLGAETGAISSNKTASDFTTRVLYSIVNGRMTKPTIITTNLNGAGLAGKYDSKLISRLFKGTKGNTIIFKDTNDKRLDLDF